MLLWSLLGIRMGFFVELDFTCQEFFIIPFNIDNSIRFQDGHFAIIFLPTFVVISREFQTASLTAVDSTKLQDGLPIIFLPTVVGLDHHYSRIPDCTFDICWFYKAPGWSSCHLISANRCWSSSPSAKKSWSIFSRYLILAGSRIVSPRSNFCQPMLVLNALAKNSRSISSRFLILASSRIIFFWSFFCQPLLVFIAITQEYRSVPFTTVDSTRPVGWTFLPTFVGLDLSAVATMASLDACFSCQAWSFFLDLIPFLDQLGPILASNIPKNQSWCSFSLRPVLKLPLLGSNPSTVRMVLRSRLRHVWCRARRWSLPTGKQLCSSGRT